MTPPRCYVAEAGDLVIPVPAFLTRTAAVPSTLQRLVLNDMERRRGGLAAGPAEAPPHLRAAYTAALDLAIQLRRAIAEAQAAAHPATPPETPL